MDYTKNFTLKNLTSRIISYFLYLLTSSLAGKISTLFLTPFFALFRDDFTNLIFDLALFLVNIVVMFVMMAIFARRDGFFDTQFLKYAPIKLNIAVMSASVLFTAPLILLYLYPEFESFRYIFSAYFALFEYNFVSYIYIPILRSIISNFYVFISILLAGEILVTSLSYKRGRIKWISMQQRKIAQLREERLEREKEISDRYN